MTPQPLSRAPPALLPTSPGTSKEPPARQPTTGNSRTSGWILWQIPRMLWVVEHPALIHLLVQFFFADPDNHHHHLWSWCTKYQKQDIFQRMHAYGQYIREMEYGFHIGFSPPELAIQSWKHYKTTKVCTHLISNSQQECKTGGFQRQIPRTIKEVQVEAVEEVWLPQGDLTGFLITSTESWRCANSDQGIHDWQKEHFDFD